MAESTIWWLLAGAAVAVELVTGTFYLLMLAAGMVAAALAAHAGVPLVAQLIVAAVVGGGAVLAWRWKLGKRPKTAHANANRDVQMDIGQTVQVLRWDAGRTAVVNYRGAQWSVMLAGNEPVPEPGLFQIKELNGNQLVVKKL